MAEVKTLVHEAISGSSNSSTRPNLSSNNENSNERHHNIVAHSPNLNHASNANFSSNGRGALSENSSSNGNVSSNNDTESHRTYSSVVLQPATAIRPTSQRSSLPAPAPGMHRSRNRRTTTITGSRQSSSVLTSGTRVLDVFVGGCVQGTTCDKISEYCGSNGVNIKKCDSLESKSEWSCSFKLSVEASDRDKLLTGEFWPQGIVVRKFYRAKNRQ